jgi:hypothetical protein
VRQRQQASGSGRALAGDQRRAPRRGREWYADGREGVEGGVVDARG